MNDKLKGLWDKICAGATVAGEFATKTASSAGKMATDVYNTSKTRVKILDLTTDIEVLYKEIGRMIYAAHCNEESSSEELDAKLLMIDELNEKIELLRAEIEESSSVKVCGECGKQNEKESAFCSACGSRLD